MNIILHNIITIIELHYFWKKIILKHLEILNDLYTIQIFNKECL